MQRTSPTSHLLSKTPLNPQDTSCGLTLRLQLAASNAALMLRTARSLYGFIPPGTTALVLGSSPIHPISVERYLSWADGVAVVAVRRGSCDGIECLPWTGHGFYCWLKHVQVERLGTQATIDVQLWKFGANHFLSQCSEIRRYLYSPKMGKLDCVWQLRVSQKSLHQKNSNL